MVRARDCATGEAPVRSTYFTVMGYKAMVQQAAFPTCTKNRLNSILARNVCSVACECEPPSPPRPALVGYQPAN